MIRQAGRLRDLSHLDGLVGGRDGVGVLRNIVCCGVFSEEGIDELLVTRRVVILIEVIVVRRLPSTRVAQQHLLQVSHEHIEVTLHAELLYKRWLVR